MKFYSFAGLAFILGVISMDMRSCPRQDYYWRGCVGETPGGFVFAGQQCTIATDGAPCNAITECLQVQ